MHGNAWQCIAILIVIHHNLMFWIVDGIACNLHHVHAMLQGLVWRLEYSLPFPPKRSPRTTADCAEWFRLNKSA
jgi:hypothetical protein